VLRILRHFAPQTESSGPFPATSNNLAQNLSHFAGRGNLPALQSQSSCPCLGKKSSTHNQPFVPPTSMRSMERTADCPRRGRVTKQQHHAAVTAPRSPVKTAVDASINGIDNPQFQRFDDHPSMGGSGRKLSSASVVKSSNCLEFADRNCSQVSLSQISA